MKGNYTIHVGNYDWGSSVDYAILTLEEAVDMISPEKFSVKERKMVTDMSSVDCPLVEQTFERTVTKAWLSDHLGAKVEGPSRYIYVELEVGPEIGSPLACTGKTQIFIWVDPYELHFDYTDDNLTLEITPSFTKRITAADMFAKKSYDATDGTHYDYAEYIPEEETDTLYVWLHGLGEGQLTGSDCYLPLMGRKGTTMAGEKFQRTIGGARVIAPQCPTYWMDADGKQTNFNHATIVADGTSYYTPSLEEFIDDYAKKMNAKDIVLAGCSNGGYMCMMLAMSRPDRYLAVVPICEAVPDAKISDEAIDALKNVPLYFVYSKNDPIVVPELHEIPTIERLKKAGATDLHVSATEKVIDTSGRYKDASGQPYEYMGHLSWICYDNNETDDGSGLSAWEWIAEKLKK